MEKNSNPAALTPQGVDQEAFDRVWRRVMPDQAQSPIAIGRAEVDEIAPAETAPQDQCEAAPGPAEDPVQNAASAASPRGRNRRSPLSWTWPKKGSSLPRPWSAGAEAAQGH